MTCNEKRTKTSSVGIPDTFIENTEDSTPKLQTSEVLQLRIWFLDGLNIYTICYGVPQICHPVSCQVIDIAMAQYSYLQGRPLGYVLSGPVHCQGS